MITDPKVIEFCNSNIRRMADWTSSIAAFTDGCMAHVPEGLVETDEIIADGSPGDGREPITGKQVLYFLSAMAMMVAQSRASGVYDVAGAITVNYSRPEFPEETPQE